MLRSLAARLPPRAIAAINRTRFEHPRAWRVLHRLARRVARGEGVIARGPAAGLRIDASGHNTGYVLGTTEPAEQAWLAENVHAGDVVYDVGANIGFHTLLMARLTGTAGAVYAFEPLPANVERLVKNAGLNDLEHVHVVAAAVGARDGRVSFRTLGNRRDASRVVSARDAAAQPGAVDIDVEQIAIDSWIARTGAPAPSLIKIDAEGAELEVLNGAMATIERCRPAMLIEVHWLVRRFAALAAEKLEPLGYVATTLEGQPFPDRPARFHAVLLASGAR